MKGKMRALISFFTCLVMAFTLTACGSRDSVKLEAKFNDKKIDSILLTNMINFTDFVEYTDGADVKIIYSTPTKKDLETTSMYFLTEELGVHKFTFNFTLGKQSKTLECEIDVVAPAPEIDASESSLFCRTGETVDFDEVIRRSGIRVTPVNQVDFTFKYVEYIDETISVENYDKKVEKTDFATTDKEYTFVKAGSYRFYIDVSNKSGTKEAIISASVLDNGGDLPIKDVKVSGVIFGENGAVKVMQGRTDSLSYIANDKQLTVATGEFYKTEVEFKGKNAPQILFFADEIGGNMTAGKGMLISLEQSTPLTAVRVYGPDRLNSKMMQRLNSFGRANLQDDNIYKWVTIITRISDKKVAVKCMLYSKNNGIYDQIAKLDWLPIEYSDESKGYTEFLGSSQYGDVIFKYSAPVKCDKEGNSL